MSRRLQNLLWLAALPSLAAAQVRISRVYELEDPGFHLEAVEGRVLDSRGAPLEGVRVYLAAAEPGWDVAYGETRTDSKGVFSFHEVNRILPLAVMIDPPAEWAPATVPLSASGGGDFCLGDIRLAANATLQVAIETAPGELFRGDRSRVGLILEGHGEYLEGEVRRYTDGVFTIDYIPFRGAELSVIFPDGKSRTAPIRIEPGQRNRFLLARADEKDDKKLQILEMTRPPQPAPSVTYEGTVRAPDGSPLEGAVVSLQGEKGRASYRRVRTAITGPNGRYRLLAPDSSERYLTVSLGSGSPFAIREKAEGGREPEQASLQKDIDISNAIPLELAVDAAEAHLAQRLRVRWDSMLGWQTLSRNKTWIVPPTIERDEVGRSPGAFALLAADLPGYFPIPLVLKLPETGASPASPIVHRFQFASSPVRRLEVRSLGKPLADAVVDLVRIDRLDQLPPKLLASYTTGADGKLELAGAPEGVYAVFVHAQGRAPGRALWSPGATMVITLAPATAVLEIEGAVRGERVRVKRAGDSYLVSTVTVTATPVSVSVAPGDYEIAALDHSGRLVAAARATASDGRTARVSLAATRPPEIRVEFPDRKGHWEVLAYRLTAGGGVVCEPEPGEPHPPLIASGVGEEAILRLKDSGVYEVMVSEGGTARLLIRRVEATGGGPIMLRVPAVNATLVGTVPRAEDPSAASPVLLDFVLLPADPDGWNVATGIQKPAPGASYELDRLPAGRYYVWQRTLARTDAPKEANDGYARRVWGGMPVTLEAGRKVSLNDPTSGPVAPLKLRVADANGKSLAGGAVLVRDPVEVSWCGDWEGIPALSVVEVAADGSAVLPNVRAGFLDLDLVTESGRVYSLMAEVKPGLPLEIRLPKEK
jgi:hypothetical protein